MSVFSVWTFLFICWKDLWHNKQFVQFRLRFFDIQCTFENFFRICLCDIYNCNIFSTLQRFIKLLIVPYLQDTFHEFCRVVSRLKSSYQLIELMKIDEYPAMIALLADFTEQSLRVCATVLCYFVFIILIVFVPGPLFANLFRHSNFLRTALIICFLFGKEWSHQCPT